MVTAAPMGKDAVIEHQLMGVVDDQLMRVAVVQCYGNAIQTSTVVVPQIVEVVPFSWFAGGEPRTPASIELVSVVKGQK